MTMKTYTTTNNVYHTAYRVFSNAHPTAPIAKPGGFTVAELLLVVVIIALVAGVGGGIYIGTYKNMLVKKAARDFVLAAKYARTVAIEQQSPCKIELDIADNGFWLTIDKFNEETEQIEEVVVRNLYFKPVKFSGDIKFEDIQITPIGLEEVFPVDEQRIIVFSPNGTAQSAIIQIGDGKNHYTVSICAATGKAKMHFGTAEEVEVSTLDLDKE